MISLKKENLNEYEKIINDISINLNKSYGDISDLNKIVNIINPLENIVLETNELLFIFLAFLNNMGLDIHFKDIYSVLDKLDEKWIDIENIELLKVNFYTEIYNTVDYWYEGNGEYLELELTPVSHSDNIDIKKIDIYNYWDTLKKLQDKYNNFLNEIDSTLKNI